MYLFVRLQIYLRDNLQGWISFIKAKKILIGSVFAKFGLIHHICAFEQYFVECTYSNFAITGYLSNKISFVMKFYLTKTCDCKNSNICTLRNIVQMRKHDVLNQILQKPIKLIFFFALINEIQPCKLSLK